LSLERHTGGARGVIRRYCRGAKAWQMPRSFR
jgi:hypothetical protein